jgi:hypothetical protein
MKKRTVEFRIGDNVIVIDGTLLRIATVRDEAWLATELEDPESCMNRLRERGTRADILSFSQKVSSSAPKFAYPIELESIAAIPLTTFREWWDKLPQEGRKNVRLSQKRGVVVELRQLDDKLIQDLVELNNETPIRQGRRFPHYGKTFDQIKAAYSSFSDRSDFICAYFGTELVGFLKVVYRGEMASILNLLPKTTHYDKKVANAMLSRAVERCTERGMTHLTYGFFNYGNKTDSPLREFKSRNGFCEVLVPRYLVPLTVRGKLGLRFKLHRGIMGILPERAINSSIRVRTAWYHLQRLVKSRCSSMLERSSRIRQMGRSNPPAGSNP